MEVDLFSTEAAGYFTAQMDYEIHPTKHTEDLIYYFSDPDVSTEPIYIIKDAPQDSIWMSLLDYDMPDSPRTLDAFSLIEDAFSCLSFVKKADPPEDYEGPDRRFISFEAGILSRRLEITERILNDLKNAGKVKPALLYFYPYFHHILSQLFAHEERMTDYPDSDETRSFVDFSFHFLEKEIHTFRDTYEEARRTIESIFMRPDQLHLPILPDEAASLYRIYSIENNLPFYKGYSAPRSKVSEAGIQMSWDEFLMNEYGVPVSDILEPTLLSLQKIVLAGTDQMKKSNQYIRKCAMCGGYFKARAGSSQTCCSRMYRDTKTTCYEYASRKSYQERRKEHPVFQEYLKAYNRLYGRIRRKKEVANTPLLDKLVELRDEFFEKYNVAPETIKETVLKDYIKANDDLLS